MHTQLSIEVCFILTITLVLYSFTVPAIISICYSFQNFCFRCVSGRSLLLVLSWVHSYDFFRPSLIHSQNIFSNYEFIIEYYFPNSAVFLKALSIHLQFQKFSFKRNFNFAYFRSRKLHL